MHHVELTEPTVIGENSELEIVVAHPAGNPCWQGFAVGKKLKRGLKMIYLLAPGGINEGDYDLAVRKTSAYIVEQQPRYGDIDTWHIGEERRGTPDEFRCAVCKDVCCAGDCREVASMVDMRGSEG